MGIKDLSASERAIVFECLRFILESNVLENDLHPRSGVDREELASAIAKWPHLEDDNCEHADYLAVNGCFAAVGHGLIISDRDWKKWFSVTHEDVRQTFQHWRRTVGATELDNRKDTTLND